MKNIYIKIISVFIIIAITLGTTYSCVLAAKDSNYFYYQQSAYTKVLRGSELVGAATTASASGDTIVFGAGQKATYETELPFNTFAMLIKYDASEETVLTIKADKPNESGLYVAATATLSPETTSAVKINLDWTVYAGARMVEITSSASCSVSSISFEKKYEYNIGPITYDMETKYIADKSGVTVTDNTVGFSSGGYAEYDFYLPFNAVSADITYSAEAEGSLTITTDEGAEKSASLNAGENIVTVEFDITERKGERVMRFIADTECEVSKITFNKEKITLVQDNLYLCNLTENEEAIQTAVLLDTKASILMVNGSRRYINNDDAKELCENFNGRVYLPAHTLARAFGMYIEDMPNRDYILIRSDKMEFAFCEDISYKEVFGGEKQTIENVVKYKDGKAYLPLRYFAEEIGKTVGYRDGIVAIDDKFSVANILNNETVFGYVKEQFAPFYPTEGKGKTYYVAQNGGSDDNVGSLAKPFETLEAAALVAEAGDMIIVREGEYREILNLNDVSGDPAAPVIFKAEGDNVYLSATEKVSGFEEYKTADSGKMIYKAKLPDKWQDLGDGRNQVFFDKRAMVEARYPDAPVIDMGDDNEPLSYLWPVMGDLKSVQTNGIYKERVESDTLLNQEEGYWVGATYVAMRGNGFYLQTAKIKNSGNGYLITEDSPSPWDTGKPIYQNYGFLSGHMNALSTNEEWFIQDGYLYIIPPEGATAADLNSKVEVKARQLVADMAESKFVRLDGFNTIGGSIRINESEMCTLANMNMKYINHYVYSRDQGRGFLTMDKGEYNNETGEYEYSHAHLNPNGEPPRGEVGIYIGGRDNVVINNEIDSAAGAAIYGVGCYTYIENNVIHDCGYAGSYVAGLFFTQERWEPTDKKLGGNFIYQNTIYNAGRAVMQHTQADGHSSLRPYLPEEIAYNDFHDGILTTQDTGITYEYWISMGHEKLFTKMHHNLVYMKTAHENPYGFGIYHDGGTMNIDTYANVVFATAPNFGFTHDKVYNQDFERAYAYCPEWNNVQLSESVVGGRAGLTAADFPNQKPFYAGAYDEEEYLVNYNKISQNAEYALPGIYYAAEAELGEGAATENNAVLLDANEYIKFGDIDFGELESNEINLEFYGDEFNTGDGIEIIIGDTIETGTTYEGTLSATAHDRDDINIFTIRTEALTEKSNVFVRMKTPKSARIYALRFGKDHIENAKLKAELIYGGVFTSQNGSVLMKYGTDDGKIIPIAWNTLSGNTITYKNVNFSTNATKFIARYSGNADRQISIKVDGEAVGTLDISGGSGRVTNETTIEQVSAGTHTVSITFAGSGYTTDLYWFKFE